MNSYQLMSAVPCSVVYGIVIIVCVHNISSANNSVG